ncbi:MAG: hypothetical protein M3P29_10645 [Acidobacteriota bacterium]|nr:hypothetical protein [Acidobacteriota bacterium]
MNRFRRILLVSTWIASVVVAFIVGLRFAALSRHEASPPNPVGDWIFVGPVLLKARPAPITYDTAALFDSDIPLPEITAFTAKVKLVAPVEERSGRSIAYIFDVRVASLQKKNIPAKYLERRVEHHKAGPITLEPITQVTYVVQPTFDVLDKDGFLLQEVVGSEQWLSSGETNQLQEITKATLPLSVSSRTARIRPRLLVVRCESCLNAA